MRPIDADELKNMKFSCGMHDDNCIVYVPIREVMENIDKAPTVGGWISVKDHSPEKGEDVIIYGYYVGPSGTTYPTTLISNIEEFKGYECVPIAWMPLPEPPKEDEVE